MHEIFLGWAEQALDATQTIPADDDLGKAVMVTDRHDWNWDRLRVQDGLISSSVPHRRGKQSGADLGARCTVVTDQRSPNLGIFLVKPIGNAGNVARAGRTMDGRNQR